VGCFCLSCIKQFRILKAPTSSACVRFIRQQVPDCTCA